MAIKISGFLLRLGVEGLRAHGSSDVSLFGSKVSSCVTPFLFLRKQKRQRRRFSTNWTFSQCHSALAGDLQEPKQG